MRALAKANAVLAALVTSALLAACSSGGGSAASSGAKALTGSAPRIIDVTMTEMAFTPSKVSVRSGQAVNFRFHNKGVVVHEAIIGDGDVQDEHAAAMRALAAGSSMPMAGASTAPDVSSDHGHGHDEDDAPMVVVEPGETGSLTATFDRDTDVVIGCHQPGHFEAGMKASLTVS